MIVWLLLIVFGWMILSGISEFMRYKNVIFVVSKPSLVALSAVEYFGFALILLLGILL